MLARTIFTADHDEFRKNVRRFLEEECVPHHARWEEQQHVDRDIWRRAGELGFLCLTVPEEYGGMGGDRLYSAVLMEEQSYAGVTGPGFSVHSDIVANYILVAEDGERRGGRRDCDDRAGHGLGSAGRENPRRA
jgi:long-chain-acyl-CoA dehydrogenase